MLDRYYQAAKEFNASVVGRLPADNPMPEPYEIDRIVDYHKKSKNAFSIIRIDGDLSNDNIQLLLEIPEIMSIKQVNILNF